MMIGGDSLHMHFFHFPSPPQAVPRVVTAAHGRRPPDVMSYRGELLRIRERVDKALQAYEWPEVSLSDEKGLARDVNDVERERAEVEALLANYRQVCTTRTSGLHALLSSLNRHSDRGTSHARDPDSSGNEDEEEQGDGSSTTLPPNDAGQHMVTWAKDTGRRLGTAHGHGIQALMREMEGLRTLAGDTSTQNALDQERLVSEELRLERQQLRTRLEGLKLERDSLSNKLVRAERDARAREGTLVEERRQLEDTVTALREELARVNAAHASSRHHAVETALLAGALWDADSALRDSERRGVGFKRAAAAAEAATAAMSAVAAQRGAQRADGDPDGRLPAHGEWLGRLLDELNDAIATVGVTVHDMSAAIAELDPGPAGADRRAEAPAADPAARLTPGRNWGPQAGPEADEGQVATWTSLRAYVRDLQQTHSALKALVASVRSEVTAGTELHGADARLAEGEVTGNVRKDGDVDRTVELVTSQARSLVAWARSVLALAPGTHSAAHGDVLGGDALLPSLASVIRSDVDEALNSVARVAMDLVQRLSRAAGYGEVHMEDEGAGAQVHGGQRAMAILQRVFAQLEHVVHKMDARAPGSTHAGGQQPREGHPDVGHGEGAADRLLAAHAHATAQWRSMEAAVCAGASETADALVGIAEVRVATSPTGRHRHTLGFLERMEARHRARLVAWEHKRQRLVSERREHLERVLAEFVTVTYHGTVWGRVSSLYGSPVTITSLDIPSALGQPSAVSGHGGGYMGTPDSPPSQALLRAHIEHRRQERVGTVGVHDVGAERAVSPSVPAFAPGPKADGPAGEQTAVPKYRPASPSIPSGRAGADQGVACAMALAGQPAAEQGPTPSAVPIGGVFHPPRPRRSTNHERSHAAKSPAPSPPARGGPRHSPPRRRPSSAALATASNDQRPVRGPGTSLVRTPPSAGHLRRRPMSASSLGRGQDARVRAQPPPPLPLGGSALPGMRPSSARSALSPRGAANALSLAVSRLQLRARGIGPALPTRQRSDQGRPAGRPATSGGRVAWA